MNFYKHFLGDYARDTGHLRLCEHGAYRALLDHYYSTAEPLPADIDALYRICRAFTDDERAAVQSVARQFFPEQPDGRRHNPRADREIAEWTARAEFNRMVGKFGGRPRKTRTVLEQAQTETDWVPVGNPKITRTVSPSEGSQNPSHSHSQNKEKAKARSAFAPPDWISTDAWQAFEEHRRKIRKPMTDRARALIVGELEKLKPSDSVEILNQSIRNGWQDVFPLRAKGNGNGHASEPTPPKCPNCKKPILPGQQWTLTSEGRQHDRC